MSAAKICPDCGKPMATHAMFNPPRCPVVRLPADGFLKYLEAKAGDTTYLNAAARLGKRWASRGWYSATIW